MEKPEGRRPLPARPLPSEQQPRVSFNSRSSSFSAGGGVAPEEAGDEKQTPLLPLTSEEDAFSSAVDVGELSGPRTEKAGKPHDPWVSPEFRLPIEYAEYESLNYTVSESEPQRAKYLDKSRAELEEEYARGSRLKWALTFLVAISTALCAVAITYCAKRLYDLKHQMARKMIEQGLPVAVIVASVVALCVAFVVVAGLAVRLAPIAAGSGIPEIKTYLNGVMVPDSMRVRTLLAKVCGVTFAVAGGMPVGKEGPMIHSGAVAGAGLSQGKSHRLGCDLLRGGAASFAGLADITQFRNDKEKRDFIACGAAAGVAAAFGAPLGGVMFCLEEGASWWHPDLTWRTLFCAMICAFATDVLISGLDDDHWGRIDSPGLLMFGTQGEHEWNYTVWEVPAFVAMGVVGGLLGAAINGINVRITHWRSKRIASPAARQAEVVVLAALVALFCVGLPALCGQTFCRDNIIEGCPDRSASERYATVLFCGAGRHDQLATLLFNSPESAIRFLFYEPSGSSSATAEDAAVSSSFSHCDLSPLALLVFALPYAAMVCLVYGTAVPSGLFVPCILSGAALGRVCGALAGLAASGMGTAAGTASHGTYALIGSAAALGGVTRMTMSLTLIIVECTGAVELSLPIFLTALAARHTGQWFNEGIYDAHIELREVPFLHWDPPLWYHKILACEIMSADPTTLDENERAGDILAALQQTSHNGFPVTSSFGGGGRGGGARWRREKRRLRGMILRKHLVQMLTCPEYKRRVLIPPEGGGHGAGERRGRPLNWVELEGTYPRFPNVENIRLTPEEERCRVELDMYCDPVPHMCYANASAWHVYQVFRQLGLRHLCVVDDDGDVVGVITRQDLTERHVAQHIEVMDRHPSIWVRMWNPGLRSRRPQLSPSHGGVGGGSGAAGPHSGARSGTGDGRVVATGRGGAAGAAGARGGRRQKSRAAQKYVSQSFDASARKNATPYRTRNARLLTRRSKTGGSGRRRRGDGAAASGFTDSGTSGGEPWRRDDAKKAGQGSHLTAAGAMMPNKATTEQGPAAPCSSGGGAATDNRQSPEH